MKVDFISLRVLIDGVRQKFFNSFSGQADSLPLTEAVCDFVEITDCGIIYKQSD